MVSAGKLPTTGSAYDKDEKLRDAVSEYNAWKSDNSEVNHDNREK